MVEQSLIPAGGEVNVIARSRPAVLPARPGHGTMAS
jgi:hypothetical protein